MTNNKSIEYYQRKYYIANIDALAYKKKVVELENTIKELKKEIKTLKISGK